MKFDIDMKGVIIGDDKIMKFDVDMKGVIIGDG